LYRIGSRKPIGGLSFAERAALASATVAAVCGLAAEVPP
jgi:hypothetical protein